MGEKRGNITIDFDLTIAFDLKLYFADYDVIFGLVHNRSVYPSYSDKISYIILLINACGTCQDNFRYY